MSLVVLAVAVLGGTWALKGLGIDERLEEYPELLDADGAAYRAIKDAWPQGVLPLGCLWNRPSDRKVFDAVYPWPQLEEVLERYGDDAPLALARVMLEKSPRRWMSHTSGPYHSDTITSMPGVWLAKHGGGKLDPVLVRMVKDESLFPPVRTLALVALSRQDSEASASVLAQLACDESLHPEYRLGTLLRYPRTGGGSSGRLRGLLFMPYHQLDYAAAASLVLTGDRTAPSMVVQGLRSTCDKGARHLLACAAEQLAADDHGVVEIARKTQRANSPFVLLPGGMAMREKLPLQLADALEAWLARNPEARATPFERDRERYLGSEERRREIRSLDFASSAPERVEELDLAAMALAVEWSQREEKGRVHVERYLDRIRRLTSGLRQDIGGETDPEKVIAILNRRLSRCFMARAYDPGRRPSNLTCMLHDRHANCLGTSLLYLAVGERLGLPLHGVATPGHIFVRWDDGKTRRNIEATEDGAEHPDESYMAGKNGDARITEEDVREGLHLVNLTRRQVVSVVLSNHAAALDQDAIARGADGIHELRCLDLAIKLDPRNYSAFINRAALRTMVGGGSPELIIADLKKALEIAPRTDNVRLGCARALVQVGCFDEALALFDALRAERPKDPEPLVGRFDCMLSKGRLKEVLAEAEKALKDGPASPGIRGRRLQALVRLRDARWKVELEKLMEEGTPTPALLLEVAEMLMSPERGAEPDPATALAMLDRFEGAEAEQRREDRERPAGLVGGIFLVDTRHELELDKRYYELRAAALDALGRTEEADKWHEVAEAAGERGVR